MSDRPPTAGAASLVVVAGATLLHPDVQVFAAMLEGWRCQQMARQLRPATIHATAGLVVRFQEHSGVFPWSWTPAHLEEWTADMVAVRHLSHATVRTYQGALRTFLTYVCDPLYGWAAECEKRFGTYPVQICGRWNTAVHHTEFEARPQRRSLTRVELQALFDAADDLVVRISRQRRKGWAAAFRDATMIKTAYAFGLRRAELVHLEVHDFGRNPHAVEFGEFGVCNVRFGKASAGSAPKRRGVLTTMGWSVEVLDEWVSEVWPRVRHDHSSGLWPSERSGRMSAKRFAAVFANAREHAGLPVEVTPHALRHSYVTHLIEDGYDALFVQQQVGHEHASTTSIYTSVSSDYRTRVLRAALDQVVANARNTTPVNGDQL